MKEAWERRQEEELQLNPQRSMENVSEVSAHQSIVNMPALLTSFVGREQERDIAQRLLQRPDVRLLTFSGAGGIGKTRLAMAVVNDLRAYFTHGIYFVPLAPVTDTQQVLSAITETLYIKNVKEKPFLELLISFFYEKHVLLLLDNFERVVGAATDIVALLKACPYLKIVVTSRAVLHVQGEYEFPVPPLTLPDVQHLPSPEKLSQYTSIALFIQRAQAVKHNFVLTGQNAAILAEICVRLDGLPLAIELAAPRVKLMSLQDLLRRLKNRFQVLTAGSRDLHERQQTLRGTIKWSYDILTEDEKKLFRRLCAFAGGFTVEAVEEICQIDNDLSMGVLDGVSALLDKSLIHQFEQARGEPRLLMMETIRDYSLECLAINHEEEPIRTQHANYYLCWIEKTEIALYGRELVTILSSVEREMHNLRIALRWFIEQGKNEEALRLVSATRRFWFLRGSLEIHEYFRDGQRLLSSALPLLEDKSISLSVRAKFLLTYGGLLMFLEETEQAERFGNESLKYYQQLKISQGIIQTCWLLGQCAEKRNAYGEARILSERALNVATQSGNDFARVFSLRLLGLIAFYTGDYPRAHQAFSESLLLARNIEDAFFLAKLPRQMAEVYYAQGNFEKAREAAEESLAFSIQLDITWNIAWSRTILAKIDWQQGRYEEAFQRAEKALEEHLLVEESQGILWTTLLIARMAIPRQQVERARELSAQVVPKIKQESDRWYCAIFLEMLAEIAALLREPHWATLLWGRAAALREEIHAPLSPTEQGEYETVRILVRNELGEAVFALLWAEGSRLSIGRVLELRQGEFDQALLESGNSARKASLPEGALSSLTRRELEVLRLIVAGQSNAQIAEQLVISRTTVNSYLRTIYSKLEVSSRTAAMRYAIDHHLLSGTP